MVGAGVIGLSAGVHLCERLGDQAEVTVMADKFSPDTTADQAGTILMPIDWTSEDAASASQNQKQAKIQRWTEVTFQR